MSIVQAIVLGIVQGLTEFIPVSSTAHLILVERVLGWQFEEGVAVAFNILIQLGTTVAVVVYFWRDLWSIMRAVISGLMQRKPFATDDSRLGWLIVVATIPALVVGLLFKKYFEMLQAYPLLVASVLIVASALLVFADRVGKRTRPITDVRWLDALIVGGAQAVALIPGVSRSGATMSGALARNFERPAAARFSFLMSIPVLVGASALAFRDLLKVPNLSTVLPPIVVGFVVAGVVGFASIHWLLGYLSKRPLTAFVWYRVVIGIVFLVAIVLLGR